MPQRVKRFDALLGRISDLLTTLTPRPTGALRTDIDRWLTDCAAVQFHLDDHQRPIIIGVFGGTGAGKSTLINRLLGENVCAASFRRTFTSGPIAVAGKSVEVPAGWLGVEHVSADTAQFPLRGQIGALLIARSGADAFARLVLIDTPDLDGDQPAHHAEADRVFRWVSVALFLVTPEKYQMTELLPYYRLAERYALPTLFVMNKAESAAAVDDYARQLTERSASRKAVTVFAVARDGAGFEPPAGADLAALREAGLKLEAPTVESGLNNRVADLMGRLNDQVIAPARERRLIVNRLIASLRAIEMPAAGVDVNPLTQQLRQRMQQRSVLYLMGPQRILDRARQMPGLLARLPRVAWDYVRHGEISAAAFMPPGNDSARELPDFRALLSDQLAILQGRIDDVIRSSPAAVGWLKDADINAAYVHQRRDPDDAGSIADEEITQLREWLEKRWNATPRDTRVLMALVKYLPGGERLTRWTEAAPYLLTLIVIAHHAVFGHVDLLVLGGYSLATWLTEKLSNEVSSRVRTANQRIAARFENLAHDQIESICRWLDDQAPTFKSLQRLDALAEQWETSSKT